MIRGRGWDEGERGGRRRRFIFIALFVEKLLMLCKLRLERKSMRAH